MSRLFRLMIVVLVCSLSGGIAGFLLGAGYSGIQMKTYIIDTNASWLSNHINRLAMIRTDRIDECIADIESTLDNCVAQLSWEGFDKNGQFHPDRIPDAHYRALRVARVYVDAGFGKAFSENSLRALRAVSPPPQDAKYCSPALREIQEMAYKESDSGT